MGKQRFLMSSLWGAGLRAQQPPKNSPAKDGPCCCLTGRDGSNRVAAPYHRGSSRITGFPITYWSHAQAQRGWFLRTQSMSTCRLKAGLSAWSTANILMSGCGSGPPTPERFDASASSINSSAMPMASAGFIIESVIAGCPEKAAPKASVRVPSLAPMVPSPAWDARQFRVPKKHNMCSLITK